MVVVAHIDFIEAGTYLQLLLLDSSTFTSLFLEDQHVVRNVGADLDILMRKRTYLVLLKVIMALCRHCFASFLGLTLFHLFDFL